MRSLLRLDADHLAATAPAATDVVTTAAASAAIASTALRLDNLRAAAVEVGKAPVDRNPLWIGTPFFPHTSNDCPHRAAGLAGLLSAVVARGPVGIRVDRDLPETAPPGLGALAIKWLVALEVEAVSTGVVASVGHRD